MGVSEHPQLFSILSNTFGGDGINDFALPDLRSRFALHAGEGSTHHAVGDTGGSESVILTTEEMPEHVHPLTNETSATSSGVAVMKCGEEEPVCPSSILIAWADTARDACAHANSPPYQSLVGNICFD